MKKVFVYIFMLCVAFIPSAKAQDFTGSWQGLIPVGGNNLRLIFNISKTAAEVSTTMDSPDQNAYGIKCNKTIITGDSLVIGIEMIKGGFKGKKETANTITGILSQVQANMQVTLNRLEKTTLPENPAAKTKPQTPVGPFKYISEEVSYTNQVQNVTLGATLTKPSGEGVFPVVLLITGSGAQDRDESIGMHKPFWVIADYLTNHGIAVLRVDDRSVGKSTGDFRNATSADFATDVMAGIDYLKTRKDIDPTKIGLLGHSEGGLIAPYVAARRKDVAFIVMLAGPAVGGKQTMFYQAVDKALASINEHDREAYKQLYNTMLTIAIDTTVQKDIPAFVRKSYADWKKDLPDSTIHSLVQGTDDQVIQSLTAGFTDFKRPWWKFFLTYDLTKDLNQLKIPVLALNGAKDEQVDPQSNLALLKKIGAKNKNANITVQEIPDVNHLFQHCKMCGSVKEYLELSETFDTQTLAIIEAWIAEQVKLKR